VTAMKPLPSPDDMAMIITEMNKSLRAIRRTVDETQEATIAAIQHPDRDRAFVDGMRAGILGEDATKGTDLGAFVETIASTVSQLHSTCHMLISERETLGTALERIGRELDLLGTVPRIRP